MMRRLALAVVLAGALFLVLLPKRTLDGFQEAAPPVLDERGDMNGAPVMLSVLPPSPVVGFEPLPVPARGTATAMPDLLPRGRQRAPCTRRGEVELHGSCWVPVGTEKAPCGADWYEHEGRCYMPTMPPERPPAEGSPR